MAHNQHRQQREVALVRAFASRTVPERQGKCGRSSVVVALVVSMALPLPGCLVKFKDWSDAQGGASGGVAPTSGASGQDTSNRGGTTASFGASGGSAAGGSANGVSHGGAATAIGPWTGTTAGGTTSGAGGSTAGGTTFGAGGSTAGGTTSGAGRTTAGGTTSGAGGVGTSAGGATISVPLGELKWLSLTGARANATDSPNGSLGIDGQFRVDSDGCAKVTFNEATRCVSGQLCDPNAGANNWGMALLFEFRNVGGKKWRWDPRLYNAVGVAWNLRGSITSRLQLWVLDMAPEWTTSCAADSCDIVGPPEGRGAIGKSGVLYFDQMDKDNWNGGGIEYTHNPADTLSLQLKIPGVYVGPASFDFCVTELGVIVVSG